MVPRLLRGQAAWRAGSGARASAPAVSSWEIWLRREGDVGWHGGGAQRRHVPSGGGGHCYYSAALLAGLGQTGGAQVERSRWEAGGGSCLWVGAGLSSRLVSHHGSVSCGVWGEGELLGEGVCWGVVKREGEKP